MRRRATVTRRRSASRAWRAKSRVVVHANPSPWPCRRPNQPWPPGDRRLPVISGHRAPRAPMGRRSTQRCTMMHANCSVTDERWLLPIAAASLPATPGLPVRYSNRAVSASISSVIANATACRHPAMMPLNQSQTGIPPTDYPFRRFHRMDNSTPEETYTLHRYLSPHQNHSLTIQKSQPKDEDSPGGIDLSDKELGHAK